MAATAASFPGVQRILKEFLRVLKCAACEWILIFLLFVDAVFSYMLTSFAQYCGLQIPCILCSRLDHVFGNVKDGYYRTLFCRNHRSELSFLLSCNVHDKLVDGRGMCDDCLLSHIEGLKSNSGMQRLFAGNLEYYGNCTSQSSLLYRVLRLCLCCDKPWASRPCSNRLLLLKSHGMTEANRNIPFPRTLGLNDLKKMRNMYCASAASHVGDIELKITSESKSGLPTADNHDVNGVVCDINESEPKKQLNDNEALDDYPSSSGLMEVPRVSASLLADLNSQADTSNLVNALEKANDLLVEKDKELQDLEAELEYYRSNFPAEIPEETEPGANINLNKEHVSTVNTTTTRSKQDDIENTSETESPKAIICPNNLNNTSETEFPEAIVVDDQPVVITAWSEIEDEKLFISQLLQKLEKKLNRLSQYGASHGNSDSQHSDNDNKDHKREQEASSQANGTGASQETSSTSTSKDEVVSKENGDTFSNGEDDGEGCRENGLEALQNEISEFNERLEALEADCSFLQRSLSYLENGKEGLVLIQEIIHLLREVKKIGLKTMDPSVTVL